ncbi:MAG: hypothetical protein HC845_16025 [Akkermansiaceae bacterium]|nr:hypothetical protein [Akkermansiaceae bacterium]
MSFRFLTIELMLQAMMEDALDGFITAAPWGKIAMEEKLGILDHQFVPGKFAQRLVMVHRKEMQSPCVLDQVGNLLAATERMTASGKPHLRSLSLENTANQYRLDPAARDIISDTATITRELQHLHVCEALPPQVAATEETANLLLLR